MKKTPFCPQLRVLFSGTPLPDPLHPPSALPWTSRQWIEKDHSTDMRHHHHHHRVPTASSLAALAQCVAARLYRWCVCRNKEERKLKRMGNAVHEEVQNHKSVHQCW